MKEINQLIQKINETQYNTKTKPKPTSRHIISKLLKNKESEKQCKR